jgi:hypothetical protein
VPGLPGPVLIQCLAMGAPVPLLGFLSTNKLFPKQPIAVK